MKHLKKIIVAIIAIFFIAFLFIYRSYNLKKLDEVRNTNLTSSGKQEVICSDNYEPVCGKNGQTYSNSCQASKIGETEVDYNGECKDDDLETKEEELTGSGIGENNLGETEEKTESDSEKTDENIIKEDEKNTITSPDYYKNLRSQCLEDECCLSSVDIMENGNYSELIDAECKSGYKINSLKCEGSYKWCIIDSDYKKNTTSNSGYTSTGKNLEYSNSNFKYGFKLPSKSYFSGYGANSGANHTVGINTNSGITDFSESEVKVYYYKEKILDELKNVSNGIYKDEKNHRTYIELNGNSIIIEGSNGTKNIEDTIINSIYAE